MPSSCANLCSKGSNPVATQALITFLPFASQAKVQELLRSETSKRCIAEGVTCTASAAVDAPTWPQLPRSMQSICERALMCTLARQSKILLQLLSLLLSHLLFLGETSPIPPFLEATSQLRH
ncbi:hypothetical protein GOP47_0014914 [Adiantum capillus-veneris]|uniref:Uncharacterized protein n=1 Tax=Adiantum capillus-veneris TaxID=13818 RepID=A0A9D4ZF92_ADICA|nr:hypothetical protein GOP47_0014914 [Adiantum capillus-veneris]